MTDCIRLLTLVCLAASHVSATARPGDNSPFSPIQLSEDVLLVFLNKQLQDVFDGDMQAEHYESYGNGKTAIKCASELKCNFEKPCKWRNVNESALNFLSGVGTPNPDVIDIVTGVADVPEAPYALAASQEVRNSAWLVSNPIPKQLGDATLDFKYWLTPTIQLRVCTRNPGSVKLNWCSTVFETGTGGASADRSVQIPGPIPKPFEILFEMSHFILAAGGMGLIDDIVYQNPDLKCPNDDDVGGDFGGSSASTESSTESEGVKLLTPPFLPASTSPPSMTSPPPSNTSPPPFQSGRRRQDNDKAICRSLMCDFDQGRTCGYNLQSNPKFPLQLQTDRGLKPAFSHPNVKAGYVVANGTVSSGAQDFFVLESQPFPLTYPVDVQLLRWQKGPQTILSICVNNVANCVGSFRGDTGGWTRGHAVITEKDTTVQPAKLLLVAEGLQENSQFVAIDSVEVLSADC